MEQVSRINTLFIKEDEKDRLATVRMIDREDFFDDSTMICHSVKAAEIMLQEGSYDMIVSDYILSDGVGTSIIPKANGKPVIIITSQGHEELASQAIELGAADCLIKDDKSDYLERLPISIQKAHLEYKRGILNFEVEKAYDDFLDQSSDLIVKVDLAGRFIFCNKMCLSTLGYSWLELTNLSIADVIAASSRPIWADKLKEQLDGKVNPASTTEIVLLPKTGPRLTTKCFLSPQFDNRCQIVAVRVMFQSKPPAESAGMMSAEDEEKYRLLVESVQDIIYSTDSLGRLKYINSRGVEVLEYAIDELTSSDLKMLIDPDYKEEVLTVYQNQLTKRIESSYLEFPVVTKRNKRVWVGQRLKILFDADNETKIVGLLGVVRDITEKRVMEQQLLLTNQVLEKRVAWRTRELEKINEKLRSEIELRTRTERALKASESEYRALIQNAHDAIVIIDIKREAVLGVNEEACRLYGYSEEEFLGKSLFHISEYADAAKFVASLRGASSYNAEASHRNKSGDTIFVDVNATKVVYKGQEAVLSINRDITVKREVQAELAVERTRRLTALIDGQEMERKRLSQEMHDGLGQLLTAAIIYLKQLKNTAETKKTEDLADKTREIIEQTIDEVRTISHNLMPSILNDFGLEVALNHMVSSVNRESNANVRFFRRGDIRRMEPEVEIGLYRIAQEALNNAIKYSRADKISVSLTTNKKGTQKLSIKDNGIGLKSVFENQEHHGNGIYNMRQRSAIIGCVFNIESAKGKGTEVTVYLCESE